jgi:hypothetical protein
MFFRRLALGLVVLAVAALAVAPALLAEAKAAKNTHIGTFVSAKGNDFTMKDKEGNEHMHTLAADAKCLDADGKECKLEDLKEGQRIRVTTREEDTKVAIKVQVMKPKKE